MVGARKYGNLQITKAIDNVNTDLTKQGEGPAQDLTQMQEVQESSGDGDQKPTGFDFTLELPTPSARAARPVR